MKSTTRIVYLAAISASLSSTVSAQIAYGVNNDGLLFRFDVANPGVVTEIAEIGFVPEGIDFRPSTSSLYAIDVGSTTTQIYTINLANAAPTPVGAGFPSNGSGYSLDFGPTAGSQTFGFDFNPTTLQPDTSMRIRLVSSGGSNLRLNSNTGGIAGVDTALSGTGVDAAAYSRNLANSGGTTTLYDLRPSTDELATQIPPNSGTLNVVGPFGVTVDALANTGFDVLTDPISLVDSAYAVIQRPDAPINGPFGAYLVYNVNLGTGQITQGALVGPAASPYDFTGGFALQPIPETGTWVAIGMLGALVGWRVRSRR